ncbi:MAG: DUF2066 domain-containing protein [Geminicoccales bacterium]
MVSVDTLGDLERFAMLQSKRCILLFISILMVWLSQTLSAAAQSADLYTVGDIPVDVVADDAVSAREQAHLQGQQIGFSRLLRRLVPARDHANLPEAQQLSVERYVQNFQIADERLSNTRYLAKMTVAFDPERVRDLLRSERLAFSDEVSAPLVVLPLYDDQANPYLWPENNPWWAAWAEELDSESGLRLIMPLGDLEDVSAVSVDQARSGDVIALRRLASRYGAKDAVVMSAAPVSDPALGGPVSIRLAARRVGGDDRIGQSFTLDGQPGETLDDVLKNAVVQLQNSLDEQWKSTHLLRLDTGGLMFVDVPISSLQDWIKINRDLENLVEVSQIEIASFAQERVQIQVDYVGDELGFEQALGRIGLSLSREGEQWLLQPTVTNPRFDETPDETTTSF